MQNNDFRFLAKRKPNNQPQTGEELQNITTTTSTSTIITTANTQNAPIATKPIVIPNNIGNNSNDNNKTKCSYCNSGTSFGSESPHSSVMAYLSNTPPISALPQPLLTPSDYERNMSPQMNYSSSSSLSSSFGREITPISSSPNAIPFLSIRTLSENSLLSQSFYIIGGKDMSCKARCCRIQSTDSKIWPIPNTNEKREYVSDSAVMFGQHIYIFGGGEQSDTYEIFDTRGHTGAWSKHDMLGSSGGSFISCCQYTDSIYLVGGRRNGEILNRVDKCSKYKSNGPNLKFENFGKLREPRFNCFSFAFNNKLYVVGGGSRSSLNRTIEVLDLSSSGSESTVFYSDLDDWEVQGVAFNGSDLIYINTSYSFYSLNINNKKKTFLADPPLAPQKRNGTPICMGLDSNHNSVIHLASYFSHYVYYIDENRWETKKIEKQDNSYYHAMVWFFLNGF
ncbi:hypothetical protein DICPUDRAFT_99606 [Dictyostelium purpureum]|uniref:Kelch repeat-containing protein n=1 Tax=Dictyostelium purpureum TaxID=5786 RepID=F1A0R8_DICPU|nr:uncharacterized protein DICPUDRAFT_99606 [Dictyostelium purpureum]EGC30206.1 hypothetical protein DICPUDRAFT_99606 [Dictyostelium purpureum]|eukprot:XP_003293269.1 hypothetical protein DICPUDRAFT_99606 [Dictyostelium purpureum]